MEGPVLGYWNIRARGQIIRLLLAYVEADFEDKRYRLGLDKDKSEWLREKFNLSLDFPNLPYYIEGEVRLTHTIAILRYLGRKYGLIAKTERESIRQDMIEQQIMDLRASLTKAVLAATNEEFQTLKCAFLDNLPDQLKMLASFIGCKPWFVGESLTYVDFICYEVLDYIRQLSPEIFEGFGDLGKFMDRFENLPTIRKYMQSDRFLKKPLFAPYAHFGGLKQ